MLRLEGDLTERRLVSPLKLPSWTNTILLTNTVIWMVVNAEGQPLSVMPVPPSSGDTNADNFALTQATAARFEPIAGSGPRRTQRWLPAADRA